MRTFGRGLRVIQSYRQSDSDPLEPEELASALAVMVGAELTEYDTARSYGKEQILGAAVASLPEELSTQLTISTKTSPNNPNGDGHGGFSREAVLAQGALSREQLQREEVLVCYLHNPDIQTDLDETLGAMAELHRQGFFKEFGVSNFPAWQVMQIWMKCKERGFCLPTVYQGVYNPIARQVEAEILPCCRMLGMRFNAYSPWAAGLLQQPWADGSSTELRGAERGRYYGGANPSVGMDGNSKTAGLSRTVAAIPTALDRIDSACRLAGFSIAEATARWHFHHSELAAGDGVIMGSASVAQLEENIALVSRADSAPLPAAVLEAFEAAWTQDLAGPAEYPAMGHMPVARL